MNNFDDERLALVESLAKSKAKKQNRWPEFLIVCTLAACSLGMSKVPNSFNNVNETRESEKVCQVPIHWIDELSQEKQKLKWTQKTLTFERSEKSNYKNLYFDLLQEIELKKKKPFATAKQQRAKCKTNNEIIPSPFKPYLHKLARHWNYRFGLTEEEMENYLAAILYNETGNAKRFIPKFAKEKYLEYGDGGFGCHAWQIDRRSHSKCYPMTFAKSGNYAIKAVLYPCLKRAHKKGYKGINGLMAAATCYNSGQFNDNYSTNFYGYRAIKHFKRLNKN